jgi:hypothetical protein
LDNVYDLLKESHELNVERAKKLCLYFALDRHDQFVADPRAKQLGIELFQEVISPSLSFSFSLSLSLSLSLSFSIDNCFVFTVICDLSR